MRKKTVTTPSRLMSLQQRSAIARCGNNGRLRWQSNLSYGHIAGEGFGPHWAEADSGCPGAESGLARSADWLRPSGHQSPDRETRQRCQESARSRQLSRRLREQSHVPWRCGAARRLSLLRRNWPPGRAPARPTAAPTPCPVETIPDATPC